MGLGMVAATMVPRLLYGNGGGGGGERTNGAGIRKAGHSGGKTESGSSSEPKAAEHLRLPGHGAATALLLGCVQKGLLRRVNRATVRVLEVNGYRIVQASGQGCCGAIHAHTGDLEGARRLARRNVRAFEASGARVIAVDAAGCGAVMKDYGHLLAEDEDYAQRAATMSATVKDVSELLGREGLRVGGPLPLSVTYDAPCHLLHAQKVSLEPLFLLRSIPELRLIPLANHDECCGGAGVFGITHPELGGAIGRDKVSAILETGADLVATGNPGCMMQIGAGLWMEGRRVDVVHPVELLDESYRRAGLYSG